MRILLITFFLTSICFAKEIVTGASPQELLVGIPSSDAAVFDDSPLADSTPAKPRHKLQPDNMSPIESGFWGENGFLRWSGIASPLTPEVRKSELSLRRTMLTMHQIGGFVTMAGLLGSVYYGQATLNGGANYSSNKSMHTSVVTGTVIAYGLTAMLSIFSPPPLLKREGEVSTTSIHKLLAWIHFTGMIITPLLGEYLHQYRGVSHDAIARFHQISAYTTTAAFAAALLVITL